MSGCIGSPAAQPTSVVVTSDRSCCPLPMFDCFIGPSTGTQVLAFYSHMGSENLRSFNTHDADLRLRDLIADIKLLLTGAVVLSPGSNNSPPVVRSFV